MGANKKTIVVVDDSEIILTMTAEALENAGYRVVARNRATGCVDMMVQERPDLVLLDVSMPGMSGDRLVTLFSVASPNNKAVVLLYSGLEEDALRSKTRASGAHGYIRKASDYKLMVQQVEEWLEAGEAGELEPRSKQQLRVAAARAKPTRSSFSTADSGGPSTLQPSSAIASLSSPDTRRSPRSNTRPKETGVVLFMDSDMLLLSQLRRSVQAEGFQTDFALSVATALQRLESPRPPNVVVCDLLSSMVHEEGLYAIALSKDPSWRHRFIFFSEPGFRRAELPLPFSGAILPKPPGEAALATAIRNCLNEKYRRAAGAL